jgi:uncharacterized membrane protein
MNAPGHLDFYAIVLFLHITAAIAAFGVPFAYPLIERVVRGRDPRSLPLMHELQIQLGRRVVTPAAVVVLIAGIYMVTDRWSDFSSGWWSATFAILLVIVGIEHAILIPNARRMRDQAALDVQGSGATAVALSTEYEQLARQRRLFASIASALVPVAVFLMVVKPGV